MQKIFQLGSHIVHTQQIFNFSFSSRTNTPMMTISKGEKEKVLQLENEKRHEEKKIHIVNEKKIKP